jgi:hypothetical protein
MAYKALVIPDVEDVHVTPSVELRTVPPEPTATHRVPFHAFAYSWVVVPEKREVHVTPSGEVTIVPAEPVATNRLPLHDTL